MGANELWAKVIGVVLLLFGVLGLFSAGELFIMSYGNMYHNIVHLVTGAIFAWAGFSAAAPTKKVNQWLGAVYALVGVVGLFGMLSIIGAGTVDHWTHLVIGVVSVGIALKAD